ncbi:MAG: hypothetical protein H0W98_02290 [Chloroflexi bacterium]|nr:hypothetical protein [Chloroflexota bacterium]
MSSPFAESVLEDAVLDWFGALGYEVAHGPHIVPGEPATERTNFRETILRGRLLSALRRLNPELTGSVLQEAERQILTAASPALLSENRSRQADGRAEPAAIPPDDQRRKAQAPSDVVSSSLYAVIP